MIRSILAPATGAFLLAVLAACTMPVATTTPGAMKLTDTAPPEAPAGSCWAHTLTPAVIETVESDVLLQPAQISADGRIQRPPVYKRETRTVIVEPRREEWFQVPCAADLTPEFIATVQRALAARDAFDGPVTGSLDRRTQAAIQRYQAKTDGRETPILLVTTARALGLWTVARSEDPA